MIYIYIARCFAFTTRHKEHKGSQSDKLVTFWEPLRLCGSV
jgi:hypothetical protein